MDFEKALLKLKYNKNGKVSDKDILDAERMAAESVQAAAKMRKKGAASDIIKLFLNKAKDMEMKIKELKEKKKNQRM